MRLFRSKWNVIGLIWKLEYQERGAPHYHCVVFFDAPVPVGVNPSKRQSHIGQGFRGWSASAWFDVVGSDDANHFYVGSNVAPVYGSGGRLMSYLAKYLGKSFSAVDAAGDPLNTGRCWGVWGSVPDICLGSFSFIDRASHASFLRRVRRLKSRSRFIGRQSTRTNFTLLSFWIESLSAIQGPAPI